MFKELRWDRNALIMQHNILMMCSLKVPALFTFSQFTEMYEDIGLLPTRLLCKGVSWPLSVSISFESE